MLWWDEIWGFSCPWATMGKGKVGTCHWEEQGTQLTPHRGEGWCPYPARRTSAITNVKERSSYFIWISKNQSKKAGTAHSGWYRKHVAAVGFWQRAFFPLIPHFATCFWHKTAQVYSLGVYAVRSLVLEGNCRKEQIERHSSTPEHLRQKCKLIKMMMMLIIIWYVK